MNFLKSVLSKLANLFTSGEAQKALNTAADYTAKALPYLDIAAEVVTGLTPTTLDDQALSAIKAKYPRIFDNTIKTGSELKLYMLGVATELMAAQYPNLTTTIARASVQLAYTGKTA
jgi:hypothetical protein